MGRKIAITKYDKPRAKWYFALFKFLEIFGLFLLTLGPYGLGCLVYKHFPEFYSNLIFGFSCTGYFCMWYVGFVLVIMILGGIVGSILLLYLIYNLIALWVKGNWRLAQRATEDKSAREKRLKQQELADKKEELKRKKQKKKEELEQKKRDRKEFGYCVGDEAKIVLTQNGCGKNYVGTKGKILRIGGDGDVEIANGGTQYTWDKNEFKITKKQKLK